MRPRAEAISSRVGRILVALIALLATGAGLAEDAPGGPGVPTTWATGKKEFLGTSAGGASQVYFTGAQGVLTEVFYPSVDRVQNVDLQFLVTDAARIWADEERRQRRHEASLADRRALAWQATTTADSGRWRIGKTVFTDPARDAVIQRVTFETLEPGKTVADYNLYLLNKPAIDNSLFGDDSRTLAGGGRTLLVASSHGGAAPYSALGVSLPWHVQGNTIMVSNGYAGINDGWQDLFAGAADKTMDFHYDAAVDGNVAQMGWLDLGAGTGTGSSVSFDVVLGFGRSAQEAMATVNAVLGSDIAAIEQAYIAQWQAYTAGLDNQGGLADDQYYLAAMSLKTVQDKTSGAMIAGLGTPWGDHAGDGNTGGYHLVWARDLFKFASALVAAGDSASANRAVEFLFNKQMEPSGRFPQNSWTDGKAYWNATQMDETADPIILAYRLKRSDLWPKIKPAAEYLAHNGPATQQERWEEMGGYSPSTIAAEVAGLVCAASLAADAHDPGAADYYLKTADAWRNNLARWTFTTSGPYGDGKYYARITANGDADSGQALAFGNGAGSHDQRSVIDGGFLELPRMGVMSPSDWTILASLPEYDAILKQAVAGKGDAWFRYNYDAYGETNDGGVFAAYYGRGRLWPIFTAERGIYEIARAGDGRIGKPYLAALKAFSSPAGLIPEQVWNASEVVATDWATNLPAGKTAGTATDSMQPLSWAMGEYINLVAAINRSRNDAPAAVCQRYSCDRPQATVTFKVNGTTYWGQSVYLVGNDPLLSNWVPKSGIKLSPAAYPVWSATLSLPAASSFQYKYVKVDEQGNVVWESGDNRALTTPASGREITVNDSFR